MKNNSLVPFDIIMSATLEDIDAIKYVVDNYTSYINKIATRKITDSQGSYSHVVDEDLKGQLENKLIEAILTFRI